MCCASADTIFLHPMKNQAISFSVGIHGSHKPDKMVQQLFLDIFTENMPLLHTIVGFQILWLIHIKNPQNPTGTVCKLLTLIADYIQLHFISETTLLK